MCGLTECGCFYPLEQLSVNNHIYSLNIHKFSGILEILLQTCYNNPYFPLEGIIQTGNQVRNMAGRKKDPLYKSFGYAFQGIFTCIRKERNMKIHCMVAALVVIAGLILGISVTEWCICLGLFGMVMALELVNTAVEAVVDLVTEERHPLAKIAKDTAAGAVLIAAIMAAIVGLIIFVPKWDLFFWEYDRNRKLLISG